MECVSALQYYMSNKNAFELFVPLASFVARVPSAKLVDWI